FAGALDVARVVEHEALGVGMAEVLEVDDLQAVARLTAVEVVNDFVALVEINELQVELLADGIDEAEQVLFFLGAAVFVTLAINKPGDLRVRSHGGTDLLGANAGGANKIRPPMIVRLELVFLPHHQGGTAHENNVFSVGRSGGGRLAGGENRQEDKEQKQSFHREMSGAVFMLRSDLLQLRRGNFPS